MPETHVNGVSQPPDTLKTASVTLLLPQDGCIHLSEEAVSSLVFQLRREGRAAPLLVQGQLLDCAVPLSTKAPVYALITGEEAARQQGGSGGVCV